ncbi:MAG: peptidyl-prolyl cis-trans isomerase [Clostridiaceae bacterium]
MKKKIISILLVCALLLTMGFAGCAKQETLAAKVGDREITLTQLQNSYTNSSAYASYSGYSLDTEEGIAKYVDYLLDNLIASNMKIYQAKLSGITLTDEEIAAAKESAQKNYDDTWQSFVDQATKAGSSNVNAYAKTLFTNALIKNGTTVNKLKASMLEDAKNGALVDKHKTALLEGVALTDEELQQKYTDELTAQKTLFDSDPTQYFTYESYSSYGYYAPPLYVPDGFFRVRQILVADEATALLIKEKLDAGEDFETLLKQYNTDPGMSNEAYAAGYLVGKGANFVESFLNASLALEKDGDVSAPVQSDYGWHIIKRVSTEAAHEIPYEDVKEAANTYFQLAYQSQYYQNILDGWVADETLVIRYPDNYASVGR